MQSILQTIIKSRATPWALLATTLAAVGCTSLLPRLHACFASPEIKELTARIHHRGREYVRGLQLIIAGDPVMGNNLLASSTNRMSILAEECMRTGGCDIHVFARALDATVEEEPSPVSALRTAEVVVQAAPEASSPGATSAASAPRGLDLEEAIPLNTPVKLALNDWLTWNRPQLADAYENYLFLRKQLAPIYAKAGLPEALLFGLVAQETGGKVHAYSSAGAAGPLQFMPITARRYGLHPVSGFDMRLDPVASTRASAAYLTALLGRFGDDLPKALAAYNLGENKLATLQGKLGASTFWDAKLSRALPRETRKYVPAVLAAARIFAHAAEYGFVPSTREVGLTAITLKEPVSIGELTICLGPELNPSGWFRTLRNLNPRMSGSGRIEAGETFRMPSMLVPVYVERCAGDSPYLARARDLHEARDENESDLDYALQEGAS